MSGNERVFPITQANESGLTKRELFAAMAMQGLLAHEGDSDNQCSVSNISKTALYYADALIEALNAKE